MSRTTRLFFIHATLATLVIFTSGCLSGPVRWHIPRDPAKRAALITLGITRLEVVRLLGDPASAIQQGDFETMHYRLPMRNSDRPLRWYVVIGPTGRVEGTGEETSE